MRVQQRQYWSAPAKRTVGVEDEEREDLLSVALAPSVAGRLRAQLYSPARLRGGLLFGHHQAETLEVILATTLGHSAWYGGSKRAVLDVDARFTLGCSEAMHEILGGSADWVGNWLIHNDSQIQGQHKAQRWFKAGQRLNLFDESHVLLICGWDDGQFICRAYRRSVEGKMEELTVNFEGEDMVGKIRLEMASHLFKAI